MKKPDPSRDDPNRARVKTVPVNQQRRVAPNVIDQRQQQIDPASQHRVDPDARTNSTSKQPGNLGE